MKTIGGKLLEELLNNISLHIKLAVRAVEILNDIVSQYNSIDLNTLSAKYEEVNTIEHEADELKKTLFNLIRISRLHPEDKEDYMKFVLSVEDITGLAKAIAKKFLIFKHMNLVIPENIHSLLKEMTSLSVKSAGQLLQLVKPHESTSIDEQEIVSITEKIEKEVDELRLKTLEEVYKYCMTSYNVVCIALPIVVDDIEEISDKCGSIADLYRLHFITRI